MITAGKLLKNKRTELKLSLQQIEQQIKIRKRFLEAVENDDYKIFSSSVYILGVLKNYSKFLGIDSEKTMAYFRRDFEKAESYSFNKSIKSIEFTPETKKILVAMLSLIFILFSAYFAYQFYRYLTPPKIFIVSPQKNKFRNIDQISITGKTEKQSVVTIYNEVIYPDSFGIFKYEFPLKKGPNILKIDVIGPNGKSSQLIKELVLE